MSRKKLFEIKLRQNLHPLVLSMTILFYRDSNLKICIQAGLEAKKVEKPWSNRRRDNQIRSWPRSNGCDSRVPNIQKFLVIDIFWEGTRLPKITLFEYITSLELCFLFSLSHLLSLPSPLLLLSFSPSPYPLSLTHCHTLSLSLSFSLLALSHYLTHYFYLSIPLFIPLHSLSLYSLYFLYPSHSPSLPYSLSILSISFTLSLSPLSLSLTLSHSFSLSVSFSSLLFLSVQRVLIRCWYTC